VLEVERFLLKDENFIDLVQILYEYTCREMIKKQQKLPL